MNTSEFEYGYQYGYCAALYRYWQFARLGTIYGESNCLVAAIVGINKIPQICASDDVQLPVHMMIMYWDMCTSGVHLMICAMHIQE